MRTTFTAATRLPRATWSRPLNCLEKSVRKGMAEIDWMKNDSDLDNVRGHPRFQALLANHGSA